MNVLLIDNFDSFTYMLCDYVKQCGAMCDVVRNTVPVSQIKFDVYDAVVISPGPETPEKAGFLMDYFPALVSLNMPVLGVCLGHQAIGLFAGNSIRKANLPRHGKTDNMKHFGDVLFHGVPSTFKATRYHSLVIDKPSEPLELLAVSDDQEVMAIKHKVLPHWGIQFHPESCKTANGMRIIKNFLDLAGNYK